MPSPLSVITLIEAFPFSLSITVSPPKVRLLPWLSIACTVITVVLLPSVVTVLEAAVIVDDASSAEPAIKVTVAVSIMGLLSIVPDMVMTSVMAFEMDAV